MERQGDGKTVTNHIEQFVAISGDGIREFHSFGCRDDLGKFVCGQCPGKKAKCWKSQKCCSLPPWLTADSPASTWIQAPYLSHRFLIWAISA